MPARLTFAPACICGMITMKMISSTSTTSTSGVTLMSGRARLGRRTDRLAVALDLHPVLEEVEELALGLIDRDEQRVGARRQHVEREHRGDRDHQTDRGDD